MSSAIVLPGAPQHLPEFISQQLNVTEPTSAGSLQEVLPALKLAANSESNYIVGSIQTPGIWWFAAHLEFPAARMLCQQNDGSWLNVAWAGIEKVEENKAEEAKAAPVVKPVTELVVEKNPEAVVDNPNTWAYSLYLAFVWEQPDVERQYEDYLKKAQALTTTHPRLIDDLERHARQGRHAATMGTALKRKIQNGESEQEIKSWIAKQAESQSARIVKNLQVIFDKKIKYKNDKRQQYKKNTGFDVALPQVELVDGLHPQSLRALKPAQEWDVYIDETGTNFSLTAEDLNESDTSLGRVVALALPVGHKLEPLKQSSHGVDLTHARIETLLKAITSNKCGVLGATLKRDLHNTSWMSAIHQLTRWLILMLPVEGVTKVRVHIEKCAPYDNSAYLKALQETLENELKMLLPKRFAGLHLSLEIMEKTNPYNGYVDAIANCWGSSDTVKRKMLARTAWRGTCLLQTTNLDRVENLYRNIATGAEVTGKDWFDICTASTQEAEYSLFHDMLEQLGEQAKSTVQIWANYLQELRLRLSNKDFTSNSLRAALNWLETYKNETDFLPKLMQLQLTSLDLATGNHEGSSHLEQVGKVLDLVEKLKDEDAVEACQAVLRVAVRATHHYDFASSIPLIEQWLDYPVAMPGLLNHAKLHSTLGQLYAFQGQQPEALKAFDKATEVFKQISDRSSVNKDLEQTDVYRAITLIDAKDASAAKLVLDLVNYSTTRTGIAGVERLARSESPLRFMHYLLLRLLVSQPELKEERKAYLGQEVEWQNDEGHPWMLINAYRAWLLQGAKQPALAADYMQLAIDGCFESSGAMLNWMGHCLLALAKSLQLQVNTKAVVSLPTGNYPQETLAELEKASNDKQRLTALTKLLPFNFH